MENFIKIVIGVIIMCLLSGICEEVRVLIDEQKQTNERLDIIISQTESKDI